MVGAGIDTNLFFLVRLPGRKPAGGHPWFFNQALPEFLHLNEAEPDAGFTLSGVDWRCQNDDGQQCKSAEGTNRQRLLVRDMRYLAGDGHEHDTFPLLASSYPANTLRFVA